MSERPIWLAKHRNSPSQRAHFAIFIPNADNASMDPNNRAEPCRGTMINVIGAPMTGYIHEVKRDHNSSKTADLERLVQIGLLHSNNIKENSSSEIDMWKLEQTALHVPCPRKNENFLAPVNDTTNKRCQEWTMEYLRHLEREGYIDNDVVARTQAERDSPTHGVGLRSIKNTVKGR